MANTVDANVTISKRFDQIYDEYKQLVDNNESTSSSASQEQLLKTIKALENITIDVSAVDMFSRNENYNEMDPSHLKFLLLPYMLGILWQLSTKENRKNICGISEVYFKDFLRRCIEYELISKSEFVKVPTDETEGNIVQRTKLTPDEKRQIKIRKFKQNKELEGKLAAYQNYVSKYDEDDHTIYSKEIYVAVIQLAINDSEDQLESIEMEMSLIKFHDEEPEDSTVSASPPRQPLKPFIITKDATQKAVYGMGYPALPILTVEELYQQRRETGQWGPPPTAGVSHNPEIDAEEQEIRAKEILEDADDEGELARKRDYDEYKDDHRRGWGNRFNRS